MVVSAAHFKDITNGYEQRTDGLYVHKGLLDAGGLRANNNLGYRLGAGGGAGTEVLFDRPSQMGYIQAYDREVPAFRDLTIQSKNIYLNPVGGTLNLPVGSVGTAAIAPNSVQQYYGAYRVVVGFTIPAAGAWYETPVQFNVTTSGGLIRLEACGSILNNTTVGQPIYIGLGVDGACSLDSLAASTHATASGLSPFGVVGYLQPAAGPHRFALFLYMPAGSGGLWAGAYQNLWVTEQKR